MTYRGDHGKLRLWRSCKTPFRCNGRGSKNPAPLGAGSSKMYKLHNCILFGLVKSEKIKK
ncbi:MAG: hypothetical protein GF311_01610 [Candidatus Lokiarchaeota archaeon]|nr:hypothetical protein [Candidatus Lokiarchaeota archaeon]